MTPSVTVAAVAAAIVAMVLAGLLTEPVRRLALRYNLTDRPAAHKAHRRPTPYLGGVALAAGTILPAVTFAPAWDLGCSAIVAGSLVMAGLGLADDIRPLRPRTRLAVEASVALAVAVCGVRLHMFGSLWPDAIATAIWIVVLTNSFNLLDNMDGAVASIALGTSVCLAPYLLISGRSADAVLLAGLAGACIGFLCHNWAPARVFLGDAGSLFIGFLVATSAVRIAPQSGRLTILATLALVTFVAVVDTILVVISRQAARRSWFAGGTDHVSHRMRRLGLTVPQIALMLFSLAAVSSSLGVIAASGRLPSLTTAVSVAVAVATAVALMLRVSAGYLVPTERAEDVAKIRL